MGDYGVVLGAHASAPDEVSAPIRDTAEAELVRRAQLGSAAAFERLVVLRGPNLHRYLVARLRSESDALDALQEALTAAWQGLPGLKKRELFWPWLVGIAANKAVDVARRRGPPGHPNVDVGREDLSFLEFREAVSDLPPHFREILLLRYFLELSEEQVARSLGVRVGTVKSRTNRARKALRELLG
jgi:RNA polymerase sigma factor (sigma-70 family)